MGNIALEVPRLEAWDADEYENGWCLDVEDLKKWLKELLGKSKNFKSDDALAVLSEGIEELIKHVS